MTHPEQPSTRPMTDLDFRDIVAALDTDDTDQRAKMEGYAADAYPALWDAYCRETGRAERAEQVIAETTEQIRRDNEEWQKTLAHIDAQFAEMESMFFDFNARLARADALAEAVERALIVNPEEVNTALRAYREVRP